MKWVKGKTRCRAYPKIASTAFANGDLVNFDGSGNVQPADATSGDHVGICLEDVAASDATNDEIKIEIPADKMCVFESEVSGTFTAAKVGSTMDLIDANTVDADNSAKAVVTCVGYINSTTGLFVLNASFDTANVATT